MYGFIRHASSKQGVPFFTAVGGGWSISGRSGWESIIAECWCWLRGQSERCQLKVTLYRSIRSLADGSQ